MAYKLLKNAFVRHVVCRLNAMGGFAWEGGVKSIDGSPDVHYLRGKQYYAFYVREGLDYNSGMKLHERRTMALIKEEGGHCFFIPNMEYLEHVMHDHTIANLRKQSLPNETLIHVLNSWGQGESIPDIDRALSIMCPGHVELLRWVFVEGKSLIHYAKEHNMDRQKVRNLYGRTMDRIREILLDMD